MPIVVVRTLPDFTISGETIPPFQEPAPYGGSTITTGQFEYLFARPPLVRNYTDDQIWTRDTSRKRHGNASVRVTSHHDGYDPFTTSVLSPIQYLWEDRLSTTIVDEGAEEWVGFSMYFQSDFNGAGCYLLCEPFASVHHPWIDTYGYGFGECPTNSQFGVRFRCGHVPNPGTPTLNPTPPNGYSALEILLGAAGMPPFTKDVWHDFYYHAVYWARSDGIMEIWHREQGQSFQKLYSNKNDGTALINRAPHATWIYNDANGTAADKGLWCWKSIYRVYRSSDANQTNHDVVYWCDGWMRRQSEAALLAEFAANDNPLAPTVTSFTPTSGTAGVTQVTINGTHFTGATQVFFNLVTANFGVVSDTEINVPSVPANATTGKIQVVTPQGSGTSITDFTVGSTPPSDLPDPAPNHQRVGRADIGTAVGSLTLDRKRVFKRDLGPITGAIDSGYVWLQGTGANCRIVVYDNDGAGGAPGSLLGASDPFSAAAAAAWVPFSFSTPAQATGETYFGMIVGGSSQPQIGVTSVPLGGWINDDLYSDGPSNPFGGTYTQFDTEHSVVIDYALSGDTRAPVFITATVTSQDLQLAYDETLDETHTPAVSSWAVTVNLSPWSIDSAQVSGGQVTLQLGNSVLAGDIVTVAYTQPGSNALQDISGNKSISLAAQPVTNQTQAPTGARKISPAQRVAIARRIDPTDRRAGEGGGL